MLIEKATKTLKTMGCSGWRISLAPRQTEFDYQAINLNFKLHHQFIKVSVKTMCSIYTKEPLNCASEGTKNIQIIRNIDGVLEARKKR